MAERIEPASPPLTVLVIGSMPPPFGGCTVTLHWLVQELRRRGDVVVRELDTSNIRGGGPRGAVRFASALARLVRLLPGVDVVTLHASTTAIPHWGLVVLGLSKLWGRPMVLRKFGGGDYRALGRVRGALAHVVAKRADLYLAETRAHLDAVRPRGLAACEWFPTTRPEETRVERRFEPGATCRRFIYVGHVRKNKGLEPLAEAMRGAPPGISLDVYGPWFPDLRRDVFDGIASVAYRGVLEPASVVSTMAGYDALVLPSLASTEGYPGVVLEAFAAGLPVIASRVGGIPEIVDPGVGRLVAPGDVAQLREAMRALSDDPALFLELRRASHTRFDAFSARRWASEFVGYCSTLRPARAASA